MDERLRWRGLPGCCPTTFVAVSCLLLLLLLPSTPMGVAGEQQSEHQNESGADKLAVLRKHAAKLQEKGGEGSFLPFSDKSVARFVRSAERPYDMLLIFTAPNHVGCNMLKNALAQVQAASHDSSLFFVEISSDRSPATFKQMGVTQTPMLVYLPHQALGEAKQPIVYQITSMEHFTDPELVAEWLSQNGIHVHLPKPLWRNPVVRKGAAAVIAIGLLIKLPALIRNYDHHLIWYFGSLCVYGFALSGVIYNAIHSVPWMGRDHRTGEPTLFLQGDMRSQYGVEGAVITSLNIITALLLVLIVNWVPSIRRWWLRVPLFVVCLTGVVFLWVLQQRVFIEFKASFYPFKF